MKDIKKLILIIAIICIIMVVLILLLKVNSKYNTTNTLNEIELVEEVEDVEDMENTLKRMNDRSDFYAVEGCITKFYTYYADSFSSDDLSEEGAKAIYSMLNEEYIKENEITQQNIVTKLKKINISRININEMYVNQKSENIYVYIVKGRLRETATGNISDFKLMLMLDMLKGTFNVFLDDYITKNYSDIELGQELEIEIPTNIEKNSYNTFDYEVIDDEEYVRKLMEKYKEEMLFDRESAYNHLDKEYREKRFENFSDFELYAKANTAKNVTLKLTRYRKEIYDDYTEYVCVDGKGNYYIFKEDSVMNYGMILDTYTIDLPDFVEKYDNQSKEQRVALNLNKVMMAINEKDYKYVYNKLNTTYKNTYFADYNAFITYLTKAFYDSNEMKIKKMEGVGQNTYNATITITNTDNSEETRELILIVRLHEDRNFEMSFGIK